MQTHVGIVPVPQRLTERIEPRQLLFLNHADDRFVIVSLVQVFSAASADSA